MESWENKIIRDKINSLQDLPDGYTPNLSSKWEIIEAGLPLQKKRRIPLVIKWTVAAAVAGILLLVWMKAGQPEREDYAGKPAPVNKIPVQNRQDLPQPVTSSDLTPVRENTNDGDIATVLPVRKKANRDNQIQAPESGSKENSQPRILSADTSLEKQDTTAVINNQLALIPPSEKVKPAKRKIYQRDFDDGVLAVDTGFTQPATQHIGIRLLPFSRKASDGDQPVRRLQWKQAL